MKKLVLGAIAALLLIAPAADAKAFRGTVVKRNVAAKTVVVATKSGVLRIVHNRRDRVGTVLRINGSRIKAVGHARRVHIKGVVTRRAARSFNLSASGAVVKVRTRGHVRSARRHGHQVGNGLNVTATVSANGTITETSSTEADDVEGVQLNGTLVCTPTSPVPATACTSPTILMIDIGTTTAPNVIPVTFDPLLFPSTLTDPLVGQMVEARVSLLANANGTSVDLTLTNISGQGTCQSEDNGDNNGGGSGGGGGGGGGGDAVARDHGGTSGCEADD